QASRPVGKAIGRIVGSDDQPRAHDQRVVAKGVGDDRLAMSLLPAIRVWVGFEGRALDLRDAVVGVHRNRGDEDVAPDAALQRGDGQLCRPWLVGSHVDDDVPCAVREGAHVRKAVSTEVGRFGEEIGRRDAPVEQGHALLARERGCYHRPAEKPGAPEHQDRTRYHWAIMTRASYGARVDDIEALKQLKARYFRLMDTKEWD